MAFKTGLLLLALVSTVSAVCKCCVNQTNESIYLANGPVDEGSPCFPIGGICTFTASTGDENVVLGNIGFLAFLSTSDNSTLWFTLKDGDKVVPGFEKFYPSDLNALTKAQLSNYVSTNSQMTFEMHFEKGQSNAFINLYLYPVFKHKPTGSKTK